MNTETLIKQLLNPDIYPHPVSVITTIETHISIVFLSGQYAYKLKKPVNFGFLDFSTLEQRKKFCQLELTLNARTAPDLYLDLVAVYPRQITQTINAQAAADLPEKQLIQLQPNTEAPIEYLVKMKQFDPNLVLGKHLQKNSLSRHQIHSLAHQIAQFHQNAEPVKSTEFYGNPQDLILPMVDNFPSLLKTFAHPEIQYRLNQLYDWTIFTRDQLKSALIARKESGFIKACHGDMHLDNITLIDDQPVLFDGIEFNEQFRWIDIINDLAFILVDLTFRQKNTLRRQLLNLYINLTGDFKGLELLKFYQVYRAMVRAKITALRYHQLEDSNSEKQPFWDKALQYISLSEDIAYNNQPPKLILMQGISGSGKSYYSEKIIDVFDAISISSDRERKRIFGIDPLDRVDEAQKKTLYSADMNQKTYRSLLEHSEGLLKSGINVIVDATFLQATHRLPFKKLAEKQHCDFIIFSIEPKLDTLTAQINLRDENNDNPSDANIAVMQHQYRHFSAATKEEGKVWFQVPGLPLETDVFLDWLEQNC